MKHLLIFASLTLAVGNFTFAGEGHNHEAAAENAPHGGILRNAGVYKSELVLEKDFAKVYVYDKDMKPIEEKRLKPSVVGQLGFPKDKKKKDVNFDYKGGVYQAKLAGIDKVHRYDLHITLEVDGKPVLADFGVDNIH